MESYNQYYTHPRGMVGLDTSVTDLDFRPKNPPYRGAQVNTFSAYPLFYIEYVRDGSVFSIEEAIQKTSTMPARVHNLEGRGFVKERAYADIVLMDLPNLKVLGDVVEPYRYPEGIEYVLVNGEVVVRNGDHTGARPGRVLRRTD